MSDDLDVALQNLTNLATELDALIAAAKAVPKLDQAKLDQLNTAIKALTAKIEAAL